MDVAGNQAQQDRDLEQLLGPYRKWRKQWIDVISPAINNHKFDDAREMLAAARESARSSEHAEELREAMEYLVDFTECRVNWHPDSHGYGQRVYDEKIRRFSRPARGRLGDCIRRMYLVYIRCNGTSDTFDNLTKGEIEEILEPLPERMSGPAWQQIARWAFEHNELETLERAFEMFLIYPGEEMGQAKWQRVNLMYQLLSGKATRRDVYESIILLELKPQLREFKTEFWPRCIAMGLVDSELEQLLAGREAEIRSRDSVVKPEAKTKSLLGK